MSGLFSFDNLLGATGVVQQFLQDEEARKNNERALRDSLFLQGINPATHELKPSDTATPGLYQRSFASLDSDQDILGGMYKDRIGSFGDAYGKFSEDIRRRGRLEQIRAHNDAKNLAFMADGRYDQYKRDLDSRTTRGANTVDSAYARYADEARGLGMARSGEAKRGGRELARDLKGGYADRFNRNMARISSLGGQEYADIRRDFRNLAGQDRQSLINSGLSGTSVGSSLRQGRLRNERDELGRLNARLTRERVATDAMLSGEALSAQERVRSRNLDRNLAASEGGARDYLQALSGGATAKQQMTTDALDRFSTLTQNKISDFRDTRQRGLDTIANAEQARFAALNNAGQNRINEMTTAELDYIRALEGFGGERRAMDRALIGDITGTIEGVNYPYSQGDALGNWMQARAAQAQADATRAANKPGAFDWFSAGVSGIAPGVGAYLGNRG